MLFRSALDEVADLAVRQLDPLLPAMKAHGMPWLVRHLAGEISLADAAEGGKRDTRHYAKRQFTWFRHQLADWPRVEPEAAVQELRARREQVAVFLASLRAKPTTLLHRLMSVNLIDGVTGGAAEA